MKKILVSILFAVLTLAIPALAASESPPTGYTGPVAERPTYIKGDWWHYQLKDRDEKVKWVFDHQETSSEGDLNVFRSGTNKSLLYVTLGLGIAKKVDVATGKVNDVHEIHPGQTIEEVKFPIWVGKKWEYNQPVRDLESGGYVTAHIEYEVASYETLNVKAGAYEAFKIVRRYETRGVRGNTWRGEEIFWYSPAAKNFIKYEIYGKDSRELITTKTAP